MFKKKVLPKKKQLEITDGETVIDIATYRYNTLIKRENQIFLIYMELRNGAVAKSLMNIRKPFLIYDAATAPFSTSLHMRKI
jgi:hypothetical protein